jgi:hypothetical protein
LSAIVACRSDERIKARVSEDGNAGGQGLEYPGASISKESNLYVEVSSFCKALLKKSTSTVLSASTRNRMEFLEAPAFTRYVSGYVTDDEYRELQNRLAAAPEHGAVIPGTGGFREASLGRPKTWQRTKRRSASDLLLLARRTTNLANYGLRQGPNFRPFA